MQTLLLTAGVGLAAAANTTIPTMNIAPGVDIPMVGLGTWQYNDTVAEAATTIALDATLAAALALAAAAAAASCSCWDGLAHADSQWHRQRLLRQ